MSNEENVAEPAEDDEASDLPDESMGETQAPVEGEETTWTPEERARQSTARIRDAANRRFNRDVADIIGTGSILKNYSAVANSSLLGWTNKPLLSKLYSDSLLELVMGKNFFVEQSWMKHVKFINSDLYKQRGLGQSNLTNLSSILFKNADFGVNLAAAKLAVSFGAEQLAWLNTLAPVLKTLRASYYPPNLRDIEGLGFEEVEKVVMLDGIALHGVPRREIAEKLIRAESSAARRAILGRRWKAISADCRAAVESCTSTSTAVAPYLTFVLAALDALGAGHSRPAQAMAANVLDTVVNGYFGEQRYELTPSRTGKRTNAAYQELTVRKFIATAPLWQAYQKYETKDGDPIPTTFSRHASVHGVSAKQFSHRNAVQALLFVSSFLLFLDETAPARQVA